MDLADAPPDVLVLGSEWRTRAPLAAQLIEEGYHVVAVEAWPAPRRFYQAHAKPRAVIVDLQGLPNPQTVIDELPALAPPERTVIVMALASVAPDDLRRRGFHVITRPSTIGQIAAAVAAILRN
jgi:CheY-like chemotaxis protein